MKNNNDFTLSYEFIDNPASTKQSLKIESIFDEIFKQLEDEYESTKS